MIWNAKKNWCSMGLLSLFVFLVGRWVLILHLLFGLTVIFLISLFVFQWGFCLESVNSWHSLWAFLSVPSFPLLEFARVSEENNNFFLPYRASRMGPITTYFFIFTQHGRMEITHKSGALVSGSGSSTDTLIFLYIGTHSGYLS